MPTPRVSPVKHDVRLMSAQLSELRSSFASNGESVTAWALARAFNPNLVFAVLHGKLPCTRGQAHHIAVALGLKPSANRRAAA